MVSGVDTYRNIPHPDWVKKSLSIVIVSYQTHLPTKFKELLKYIESCLMTVLVTTVFFVLVQAASNKHIINSKVFFINDGFYKSTHNQLINKYQEIKF